MSDEKVTKRMGQMLRKGAALLNVACPKCNTPLLRLQDGSMYCVKCDKEVVEKEPPASSKELDVSFSEVLNQLATKVLINIERLTQSLPENPHPEELRSFAEIIKDMILILRGIRELQS
ncbi:MAG: Sjogren's syndrome/scleroderma autoantigen 1 family protein [Candidatus Hermodarchaeota archaeon]|nr:Sjogren's syndrome/scleroderma autoantigen 1 family protein [Candidatus Hermodarchaeota archaeon]